MTELEKKNLKKESFSKVSLKEAIGIIYSDTRIETKDASAEMMKKIGTYSISYQGGLLPRDNLKVEVSEYEEGGYQAEIQIKNPKKIDPRADRIDPIIVEFDKDGKLQTTELDITGCMVVFGQEIPGKPQKCLLKQEGNTIIVSIK